LPPWSLQAFQIFFFPGLLTFFYIFLSPFVYPLTRSLQALPLPAVAVPRQCPTAPAPPPSSPPGEIFSFLSYEAALRPLAHPPCLRGSPTPRMPPAKYQLVFFLLQSDATHLLFSHTLGNQHSLDGSSFFSVTVYFRAICFNLEGECPIGIPPSCSPTPYVAFCYTPSYHFSHPFPFFSLFFLFVVFLHFFFPLLSNFFSLFSFPFYPPHIPSLLCLSFPLSSLIFYPLPLAASITILFPLYFFLFLNPHLHFGFLSFSGFRVPLFPFCLLFTPRFSA